MIFRLTLACWLLSTGLALSGCAPKPPQGAPALQPAAATQAVRRLPQVGAQSDPHAVAVGVHGAVASAEPQASAAALAVLKSGGNAVDAAIALAFALAVTHPSAGNLGGGGFMVLRTAAGESFAIDYRETAPLAATRDMYLDDKGELTSASVLGARAAGVPGTVAGLELAHARFASKPWRELVAPAIRLARDGHVVDASHAQALARAVGQMRSAGFEASARVYCNAQGAPIAEGELWKQPELAQTLESVAESPRNFYQGALASTLVQQMRAAGGIWSDRDLAEYRAQLRAPVQFEYRGHQIFTMPLPSAGGIVMRQILFASEKLNWAQYPVRSPQAFHLYVEATRRAYADRNEWLADPEFVKVPVAGLLDPQYIAARMQDIDPAHATPSAQVKPGQPKQESHETTHFSVVDDHGAAVSNTYTLNSGFGAKLVLPGTGVLLNNEMDDFAGNPGKPNVYGLVQGERNKIEPKKRMLSSMTPTIVVKDGQLRAVLGTPGGPTITTTVVQLIRNLLDYGMSLDAAVRAGRVHHQWLPDEVIAEPAVEAELIEGLKGFGHKVTVSPFGPIGHADCIEVDPATNGFRAVADVTRSGGGAAAY